MIELIAFILVWGVLFTCGVAAIFSFVSLIKELIDGGDYLFAWEVIAASVMVAILLIALVLLLIGVLL